MTTFTREQKQDAYKRLPVEAQDFITSTEVTERIENLLRGESLTEEQVMIADGEIFSSMLGLQTLESAVKNVSQSNSRQPESFSKLQKELRENIFDNLEKLKREKMEEGDEPIAPQVPEIAPEIHPVPQQAGYGTSPTVEEGDVAREAQPTTNNSQPTTDAPTEQLKQKPATYPSGKDPYREPIE